MDLETLPSSLTYLRGYLKRLTELDPDDVNEDTDIRQLNDALRARAESCGVKWQHQKSKDLAELTQWLEAAPDKRSAGFFVIPFLEAFDLRKARASKTLEESRKTHSGFAIMPLHEGESVEDHFGRLDLCLANGVLGTVMVMEDSEQLFNQKTAEVPGMQHENEVLSIDLGPWKGKKLVQSQFKPFHFKRVEYFLTNGRIETVVSVFREDMKYFEESRMEVLLADMTYVGSEQGGGL